jgi:hypothetical protein
MVNIHGFYFELGAVFQGVEWKLFVIFDGHGKVYITTGRGV